MPRVGTDFHKILLKTFTQKPSLKKAQNDKYDPGDSGVFFYWMDKL